MAEQPTVTAVLDERDGLSSTEMARYGHALAPEGTLYLATANGMSTLAADGPAPMPMPIDVELTVSVAGKDVTDIAASADTARIETSEQEVIDINWRAQSLWRPEQNRYEYRLLGGDNDQWTSGFSANSMSYTLMPGTYTFEMRLIGADDRVLDTAQRIFVVNPLWYNSWWFRALVVASLLLGAAWFVVASQRRQRKLEHLVSVRTEEAETRRAQAERASREIQNLLHRVSHDLRSPLNNMVGAMDLVESAPEQTMRSRWLGMGRAAARRLTVMLDDLIVHARAETGRGTAPRLVPTEVESTVNEVIDTVNATDLGVDREIVAVFEQTSQTVLSEQHNLRHLLTDVLLNAASHSRPGTITVRVRDGEGAAGPDSNVVVISVIDPGSGLTDEQLAALHEPYRRGDGASGIGLGLGLTVAQNLTHRMGGQMTMTADPERTEATIELTARVPHVHRVLIADDEPALAQRLGDGLRDKGYAVETAGAGADVAEVIARTQPDLVVIGHELSGTTGAQALQDVPGRVGSPWSPRVIALAHDPGRAGADGRYAMVLDRSATAEQLRQSIDQLDRRTVGATVTEPSG